VEDTQPDPSVLVLGLNPGKEDVIAGKITMFAAAVAPLLGLIQGFWREAGFFFCIAFLLSIVLTCGQQYVLDSSSDMLKKRKFYFLRPTQWTELGKLSDIHFVRRRAFTSRDEEPLNSWIDFVFKDKTSHRCSVKAWDIDEYHFQINAFLKKYIPTYNPM